MNAETMTFGVEIECVVPSAAIRARGINVAGYHSTAGQSSAMPQGWRATSDGSIRVPSWDWTAVEFVSPILSGADGLASLKAMCELLREMGAKVNASCGLHVHVGCPADANIIRNLTINVARFETALWAASGTTTRQNNSTYCKSIKTGTTHRAIAQATNKTEAERAIYNAADRYHVLNLTHVRSSLGSTNKTVEFRVFAGTTNYTKIGAYVQVCLGLVAKSAKRKPRVEDFDRLTVSASRMRKTGAGSSAMSVMLQWMAWVNAPRATKIGVLVADVKPFVTELRRLAGKYDEQLEGRRSTPNTGDIV